MKPIGSCRDLLQALWERKKGTTNSSSVLSPLPFRVLTEYGPGACEGGWRRRLPAERTRGSREGLERGRERALGRAA